MTAPNQSASGFNHLLERRTQALSPSYRLFYEVPVHPVKGEGVWLYDQDGRRYLDAYNNVPCVGHSHPRIVAAVTEQVARLNTHTRYLDDGIVAYAERLKETLPDALDRLVFTCSGSEANDLAVRIARAVTGGIGIVATDYAYHGATTAVSEFSGALVPTVAAHVRTVAPPGASPEDKTDHVAFAQRVHAAFSDLQRAGVTPSMLIFDTIFASDGLYVAPSGALAAAEKVARGFGALVAADEVQSGFGRIGETFWGTDFHGLNPDIISMGKPMGAGYPLAGIAMTRAVADAFAQDTRYFSTFGGTPVAAAAGLAVLNVLRDERLQDNARTTGAYLGTKLQELLGRHESISQTRGQGLFWGISLTQDATSHGSSGVKASVIVNALRQRGVLISSAGPGGDVLKIRPPLSFEKEHADLLVATLDDVLAKV